MSSFNIQAYWQRRYQDGRDSGEASRGKMAKYKADYVNEVIDSHRIRSMIDWGCGDGVVLKHITSKVYYTGIDVSPHILTKVAAEHPGRFFVPADNPRVGGLRADLALSMDVLFHLVNGPDYYQYLDRLFGSASQIVLIYSTNHDGGRTARHVLRRQFTPDVENRYQDWYLELRSEQDDSQAGFFLYRRR